MVELKLFGDKYDIGIHFVGSVFYTFKIIKNMKNSVGWKNEKIQYTLGILFARYAEYGYYDALRIESNNLTW